MDYWNECISEAFDEEGIVATPEQIDNVARSVEVAHENYGMAFGHDAIPNPLLADNQRLERELKTERDKVLCRECNGHGRIIINGPVHSYDSECTRCRGEGRYLP